MDTMDFAAYAAVSIEEIPEAALLPKGTYQWFIAKPYTDKETSKGNGRTISFQCKIRQPIDDFEDPEALDDFPGGVVGETRTLRFYYPEKPSGDQSLEDVRKFQDRVMRDLVKFLTVDLGLEGDSVSELLANAPGAEFLGLIEHKPDSRNPENMQDELTRTAPIE